MSHHTFRDIGGNFKKKRKLWVPIKKSKCCSWCMRNTWWQYNLLHYISLVEMHSASWAGESTSQPTTSSVPDDTYVYLICMLPCCLLLNNNSQYNGSNSLPLKGLEWGLNHITAPYGDEQTSANGITTGAVHPTWNNFILRQFQGEISFCPTSTVVIRFDRNH